MNVDEVKSAISNKFADVPHPGGTHLVHHNRLGTSCKEHPELEKLLGESSWTLKSIESNADQLSFLTPEAFRYFFPKFLVHALDMPDTEFYYDVFRKLTAALESIEWFFKRFDTDELQLMLTCLEFSAVYSTPLLTEKVLKRRLKQWKDFLDQKLEE